MNSGIKFSERRFTGTFDPLHRFRAKVKPAMTTIDARGLSCPEPVIMTRKAMIGSDNAYEILVDNVTAKENVTRYAEHQGYTVTVTEKSGEYTLTAKK